MDAKTKKTLDKFGSHATKQMRRKASKYSATGKTAASFRYEVTSTGLTIFGAHNLRWAETGRGPTREDAPKGSPTLYEAILRWVKIRGIAWKRNDKALKQSQIAWMITKKIHREGTKLWRDKGFRDIYSSAVSEQAVNKVIDSIRGDYIIATSSDLIKIFNQILDTRKAA